jgi:hypothetical protein
MVIDVDADAMLCGVEAIRGAKAAPDAGYRSAFWATAFCAGPTSML